MAMNQQFLHALENIRWIRKQDHPLARAQLERERDAALDALLRADPANGDQFRRAIFEHRNFWGYNAALRGIENGMQAFVESEAFLNPNEAPGFQRFHQLAAHFRVQENLYKADDNVLIAILTNNPDECRAYLAEKAEFGLLKEAKGWQPNEMAPAPAGAGGVAVPVAPPQNKSIAVLDNQSVLILKEGASELLLPRLIQKCTDKAVLKQLLEADNQAKLDAALRALGFPQSVPPRIVHPHSMHWVHSLAVPREQEVREAWAKGNVHNYIKNLSDDEVLARKNALPGNWGVYRHSFDEPYKTDLSEEDLRASCGLLGARYLQIFLSQMDEDFVDVLNADDKDLASEIIKFNEVGSHGYVAYAANSNPSLIRQGMLQSLIRQLEYDPEDPDDLKILCQISSAKNLDEFKEKLEELEITNTDWIEEDEWKKMQGWSHTKTLEMISELVSDLPDDPVHQDILKQLNTAKNIEEFRDGLRKLGVDPVDWVTHADKDHIQKLTRPRAFEMHVNMAKFGPYFRPELLSALEKLPPKKQEALLAKPEQLRHLLNAKDANAVAFYLGREAQGIAAVVDENVKLSPFHQLHNVPVARALASTGFALDESKIPALNAVIASIEDSDFDSAIGYRNLVDRISLTCGIPQGNPRVYAAFGLNDAGADYLDDEEVATHIKNQSQYNTDLYSPGAPHNKEIINLLLRLEKTEPLTPAHIAIIEGHFNTSGDLKTFLDKIGKDPNSAIKGLKTGMEHELTAISFNQLKIKSWAAPLYGADNGRFDRSIKDMKGMLAGLKKTREDYGDIAEKFQFVADVNPLHLAAPQFIRECRDDPDGMRAKVGDVADKCDLIVDRLLRNQAMLKAQLASLPDHTDRLSIGDGHDEGWEKIIDLRKELEDELESTMDNLAVFRSYQDKLSGRSGILQAIDNAIDNKKNAYYQPATFRTTIVKAGSAGAAPAAAAAPIASAAVSPGSSRVHNFLTGDRLGSGDKCDYEMDYAVTSGQPPTNFRAEGKFVERHNTVSPASPQLKGGQIIKQPQCSFVVETPPHQTHPPRKPRESADTRLNDAKANFYMGMAVGILSRFDAKNPPSKDNPIRLNGTNEEEMRHLWTALVIVGEKNAKNMRFGRDAVIVESGPFNPAKERGMLGFTKESLYTKYKKDHAHIIASKAQDAQGMAQEQTEHIDAVKSAERELEKFKKGINDIKIAIDGATQARDDEGAAPDNPSVVFKQ